MSVTVQSLSDDLLAARRHIEMRLADPDRGLLASESLVLAALDGGAKLAPSRLAAAVGISRGRTTKIIDHLVDADLVVREPDPHDHRGLRIALTANGRLAAEAAAARVRRLESELRGALGEAGVAMLGQQLRAVSSSQSR